MIGRIAILDVWPVVHCGRYPAKAVPGEAVEVSATVFREGHEMLGAGVRLRDPSGENRPLARMRQHGEGTDRWAATVTPDRVGRWLFRIEAWGDPIAHWRHDAWIKVPIGQDVELMLAEGAILFRRAAASIRAPASAHHSPERDNALRTARRALARAAARLEDSTIDPRRRLAAATDPEITAVTEEFPLREPLTRSAAFPLILHRERALYSAWYEFFPRSEGAVVDPRGRRPARSGTFATAAKRLDAIASMGFDVVYLPPIHPIGETARKGRNNSGSAVAGDPGSPWAIGSAEGGHDAVHPDLGTIADFDAFVTRARELGLEVALDLALQASPDHPWVKEHPEWFTTRADGTIAYAENPPKKYQDIYPLNFDDDPHGIYRAALELIRHWIRHGIKIFRVDNPHTKPLPFWERLIAEVADTNPDVIFLAEAFTRPAMMHTLAAIGFHQSYTYFTWRNSKEEIEDYLRELSGPAAACMRPNFFVNTPDILSRYLQHAGPAAFKVRAVLAAMLSPSWGVYSGFELCENVPLLPGSEEYLNSEKYEYRPRDWDRAERLGLSLAPLLTQLNAIRRKHACLHFLRNLRFHHADQPEIICFSKSIPAHAAGDLPGRSVARSDTVLVVVNLDPSQPREATVWLDLAALGIDGSTGFAVRDELSGATYRWHGANYVRLDPAVAPAHIFSLTEA